MVDVCWSLVVQSFLGMTEQLEVGFLLIGVERLLTAWWGQRSDRALEWMVFVIAVVSSVVMGFHVVRVSLLSDT